MYICRRRGRSTDGKKLRCMPTCAPHPTTQPPRPTDTRPHPHQNTRAQLYITTNTRQNTPIHQAITSPPDTGLRPRPRRRLRALRRRGRHRAQHAQQGAVFLLYTYLYICARVSILYTYMFYVHRRDHSGGGNALLTYLPHQSTHPKPTNQPIKSTPSINPPRPNKPTNQTNKNRPRSCASRTSTPSSPPPWSGPSRGSARCG